jgi:hypothetical protein
MVIEFELAGLYICNVSGVGTTHWSEPVVIKMYAYL